MNIKNCLIWNHHPSSHLISRALINPSRHLWRSGLLENPPFQPRWLARPAATNSRLQGMCPWYVSPVSGVPKSIGNPMSPEGTINWMCFKNGSQERLASKFSSLHLLDCVNFFCESPMVHKKHLGPPLLFMLQEFPLHFCSCLISGGWSLYHVFKKVK